jgi:hypothetical protein
LSVAVEKCPELAELIPAWPALPADVRKMILGVVRVTAKQGLACRAPVDSISS